ncbi:MAG: hypothetical protein JWS12_137 [Candidatus Saccharibacteria bacterium]|nr:hypothetical protein [Candidatus Saccharibacteria bacterium]
MVVLCMAFLLGLVLAKLNANFSLIWLPIAGLLLGASWLTTGQLSKACSLLLLGVVLGWWRGQVFTQQLLAYTGLNNQKVTITATATTDAVYDRASQLSFDVANIHLQAPAKRAMLGQIGVTGYGVSMVHRGDMVKVTGKLFQTRGARQARIGFAQLSYIHGDTAAINTVRLRFLSGMQSALPEPLASFGLGLLIGQRNTLPQIITLQLSVVGLTHLIAVSGYNLTILMRGVRRLTGKRSKYQTTMLSLLIISVFLLFSGFSASIVRAALVSMLSLGAWYYGRRLRPLLVVLLPAALTAGWYPLYLWSDLGWHLSFLAFFGILIVAPLLTTRFHHMHRSHPLALMLIESLAAEAMTLPVTMLIFGQISLTSLLANVLVVPMVPIAMFLSMIAGLGGLLAPSLAGWLAWPARLVLTYMLDVVHVLSRLPHAATKLTMTVVELLVAYAIIVLLSLVMWHKTRLKHGIITEIKSSNLGEVS